MTGLPPDPDAGGRPAHLRPALVGVVALGGLVGAPLRYGIAQGLHRAPDGWPTATLVTNLVGALLLGVLLEALARSGSDVGGRRLLRLGLGTGVLGAFTTYSTLAVEADLLVRAGRPGLAVGYAVASLVGGLVAVLAGLRLGQLGRGHRR